jgi:hypothetical protein
MAPAELGMTALFAAAIAAMWCASIVGAEAQGVGGQPAPGAGQPAPGVRQSVPDLDATVAYQRAFEATLWAMPAVAIYRIRVGMLNQPGMADNVIDAFSGPLHTFHELITANQVTPYLGAVSDLRQGPVVLEVPAKTAKAVLYGQIVDAWQATIADVGPSGTDKGQGGKYLLVPPGYTQPIPEGYFVLRSSSYRILFGFRSIQLEGATEAEAYAYSKTLKMYPLSEAANPPPTRYVDGRPYPLPTLPFYDTRALHDIYDIITVEPVQPRDKVMMGMLATIGIEPGKPFNPPEKYKAAMEKGIVDAYYYMQNLDTKLFVSNLYWPDRHWSFVMVPDVQHEFGFVSNDAVEIDKRAAAWFFFTFYPKVLTDRAGTVYLAPIADSGGRPIEAGKTYKLCQEETPAPQQRSRAYFNHLVGADK